MDLIFAPGMDSLAAGGSSSAAASFAMAIELRAPRLVYTAGPGDDDEDDEDPATGGGSSGNIDPDDDDSADEEDEDDDEDDDEDPLWAALAPDATEYPRSLRCSIACYNPLRAAILRGFDGCPLHAIPQGDRIIGF